MSMYELTKILKEGDGIKMRSREFPVKISKMSWRLKLSNTFLFIQTEESMINQKIEKKTK